MPAPLDASSAIRLRLSCGLLASAARLVPVPFLDDLLRAKAIHLLVSRTLRAHGRSYGSARVPALYQDGSGCLSGCLAGALVAFAKLILFPIRKVLVWVMAARWLARDLSEAVLLGRALDRILGQGRLPMGAEPASLAREADLVRRAFDNALGGTDLQLLRGALTTAVRSVSGLPRAALAALRGLRTKDAETADPTAGLSPAQKATMDAGTDRISAALETPEVVAYLTAFDARFDENLAILEQRRGA